MPDGLCVTYSQKLRVERTTVTDKLHVAEPGDDEGARQNRAHAVPVRHPPKTDPGLS